MPSASSPWTALLPAALTGTRRQPFASLPGLTPDLGAEAGAAEKQLLLTAASLYLVRRAGRRPSPGPADSLSRAPAETLPVLGPAAVELLWQLLTTDSLRPIVDCCLRLTAGRRLPHGALAALPSRLPAQARGQLLGSTTLGGARRDWLPGWPRDAQTPDDGRPLTTGWWLADAPARQRNLLRLARQWPPQSRDWDWLRAALQQGTPAQRQALLPVLERWADDAPVPAALLPLLQELYHLPPPMLRLPPVLAWAPGQPLLEQFWEQARPLLSWAPGAPQLTVSLPTAAAARDFAKSQAADHTDKKWPQRLRRVCLSWVRPSRWAEAWGVSAAEAVALAAASEQAQLLLDVWLEAATRFRDLPFIRALLVRPHRLQSIQDGLRQFYDQLLAASALLPAPEQAAWRQGWLPPLPHPPLRLRRDGRPAFPSWLDWASGTDQEAVPAELMRGLIPFMRAYFALPPATGGDPASAEALLGRRLEHYASTGDLGLAAAVEAELLPLARAQPARPLSQAVRSAWELLTFCRRFAASLATPAQPPVRELAPPPALSSY